MTAELTAAQVRHFDTFGFVVRPQLFAPADTQEIVAAFEKVMAEDRAGESFRGDKRHSVVACAERHPAMRALIDDPRIVRPIEQVFRQPIMWWGSDGNYYVGDTAWHPDGCDSLPCQVVASRPGDVVFFDQNLFHASFGGRSGRRMFTLCYCTVPEDEPARAAMQRSYDGHVGNSTYPEKIIAYSKSRYALSSQLHQIAPEQWTAELLGGRQARLAARATHLWRSDFA